jgi:outer membrane immunogenic protein
MTAIRSRYATVCASIALAIIAVAASPIGARAEDKDLSQVLSAMKALESRVAALESENRTYRREAAQARAEAQALKQRVGAASNVPVSASPPGGAYAMATKAAPPLAGPTWSGLYAGASFGLAAQRASLDTVDRFRDTSFDNTGFSDVTTGFDASSLGGRGTGTLASLFLGYNVMPTGNVVLGGQLEGTVANIRTPLKGTFNDLDQDVATFFGAPSTSTTSSVGNTTDRLDNRWMISALARAGVLVDSADLVYVLGGWTYGRFDYGDHSFGLHGGTVGAGWERQIAPMWTLRAEYRYTRFQNKTITDSFNSTDTTTGTNNSTSTFTAASASTSTFSGVDLQSVMVGVSHYFNGL